MMTIQCVELGKSKRVGFGVALLTILFKGISAVELTPVSNGGAAPALTNPINLTCPQLTGELGAASVLAVAQNRVVEYLGAGLAGAADKDDARRLRALELWREIGILYPGSPLGEQEGDGVAQGTQLPKEVVDAMAGIPANGHLPSMDATTVPGREALYRFALLEASAAYVAILAGGDIPSLLQARHQQLPPTGYDLHVYLAIKSALREIGSGVAHTRPSFESVEPFARSRNPIYRLIAIDIALVSIPQGSRHSNIETDPGGQGEIARCRFFRSYADETDEHILRKSVKALEEIGSETALSVLHTVRDTQSRCGRKQLADIAGNAAIRVEASVQGGNKSQKP